MEIVLGQLKWLWLRRPRRIRNLTAFYEMTRGIEGATMGIVKLPPQYAGHLEEAVELVSKTSVS